MQSLFSLLKERISQPLTLIDVGAAGGAIDGWQQFGDKARVFCFEAREDETADLTASNSHGNIEYVPLALAEDDQGIELNIAAIPTCSSVYTPIKRLYERYPGCAILRPVGKERCPSIALDTFLDGRGLNRIHAVKLDTQGYELNILRGGMRALRDCLFAIIEVEFNAIYEGQPLFCDVDRFMRDNGFVLWRLNNLSHYSTGIVSGDQHAMMIGSEPGGHNLVHFANGQLFWGDAFYVKAAATPLGDEPLQYDDAIAGAALASQWNFLDLALEMIKKSGDKELLAATRQLLGTEFVKLSPDAIPAEHFHTQIAAERTDVDWKINLSRDVANQCLVYGPYMQLPQGRHEVEFKVELIDPISITPSAKLIFDVAQDTTSQTSTTLEIGTEPLLLNEGRVKLRFYNDSAQSRFEFRIYSGDEPLIGAIKFGGVKLRYNVD
jgi:FkbM family methyltransferase